MELIGWLGSLCFAFCALPQAIQVHKEKNADGTSHGMLWLWIFGEIFTLIYVYSTSFSLPLVVNYCINLLILVVIVYYKYFYGKIRKTNL